MTLLSARTRGGRKSMSGPPMAVKMTSPMGSPENQMSAVSTTFSGGWPTSPEKMIRPPPPPPQGAEQLAAPLALRVPVPSRLPTPIVTVPPAPPGVGSPSAMNLVPTEPAEPTAMNATPSHSPLYSTLPKSSRPRTRAVARSRVVPAMPAGQGWPSKATASGGRPGPGWIKRPERSGVDGGYTTVALKATAPTLLK